MINVTLETTMTRLVREYSPKSYLEIGCYDGRSLRWVLDSSRPLGGVSSLLHLAICDTWDGPECKAAGFTDHSHINSILDQIYRGDARFLHGRSQDLLPELICEGVTYELILVDGSHEELPAFVDLLLAWKLLRPGGWLVMDDVNNVNHPHLDSVATRFHKTIIGEIMAAIAIESPPNPPTGHIAWRKRL